MSRAGLLLALVAQAAAAFNLDTAHPLVWSGHHSNFGYKLELRKSGDDGYSLLVAAPTKIPVAYNDICTAGICFRCLIKDNYACAPEEITFPETTFNKPTTLALRRKTSLSPLFTTKIMFEPQKEGFKVTLPGSPPREEWVWRGGEEQPWNIYDRAWCVADLNGDGSEDLVLGSWHYSHQPGAEEGLVLVYFNQDVVDPDQQVQKIAGRKQRGANFGRSVSCIGDINQDGLQDIAVGAPGEDAGRGAIYIYHGKRSGIDHLYSQRISATDVDKQGKGIRGFGGFISEGVDVDKNAFIDLAVGASDSRHVVLLRARPVVRLLSVFFSSVADIGTSPQFAVSYRITVTATHDQRPTEVQVWVQADHLLCVVEAAGSASCAESTGDSLYSKKIALFLNRFEQETIPLSLKEGVVIFPDPISLKLHYKLSEPMGTGFCKTCPVVDPSNPTEVTLKMNHAFSCGKNICNTDLRLNAEFINNSQAAEGQPTTRKMCVTVESLLQPAFLATVVVECAAFLPVNSSDICSHSATATGMRLRCDVGNPLSKEDGPRMVCLALDLKDVPTSVDQLQFNLYVSSAGEEHNTADNFCSLTLTLRRDESPVSSGIFAVSFIIGLIICALLSALVIILNKRRKCCTGTPGRNFKVGENSEPEYAVPEDIEDIDSRKNHHRFSEMSTVQLHFNGSQIPLSYSRENDCYQSPEVANTQLDFVGSQKDVQIYSRENEFYQCSEVGRTYLHSDS